MKRVLLLLPTTGYRNHDFLAAANKLRVEIVAVANYCHPLAPTWGLPPIMGFVFARAMTPADADAALRTAHRRLHFDIRPEYPAMEGFSCNDSSKR